MNLKNSKQTFLWSKVTLNDQNFSKSFFRNGRATLKWNKLASKFKFRKKNSKVIKIKSGRSRSIKDIFTLSHVNPARFKSLEMRSFLVISDQVNSGHFLINFSKDLKWFTHILLVFVSKNERPWSFNLNGPWLDENGR